MKNYSYLFLAVWSLCSCEGFLDEKPEKSILVPETVTEFEVLIDNYDGMNYTPVLPFLLADNYWTTNSNFQRFTPWQQNAYLWSKDPYLPSDIPLDYALMYQKIFKSNVLLDAVKSNPEWSTEDGRRLSGKAYFWRALAYFELAKLHLPIGTVQDVKGIYELPLVLSTNLDQKQVWSRADVIFEFIKDDLNRSLEFLPVQTYLPTQPSYYAGKALLARVNLYLGEYESALENVAEVLKGPFNLLDYAELDLASPFPFQAFNSETILFTYMAPQSRVSSDRVALVDSLLVFEYDTNDTRAALLVKGGAGEFSFKGNYTGNFEIFTGIALDEIMLIQAEAFARSGNKTEAIAALNLLLEKRILDFIPLVENDVPDLLNRIKSERRKSLVFRGQRWSDMKRWAFWDQQDFQAKRVGEGNEVVFRGLPDNYQIMIPQRELEFKK